MSHAHPYRLHGQTADPELISWIKARIRLPHFQPDLHWSDEHDAQVSSFLLSPSLHKLLLYLDPDLGLVINQLHSHTLKRIKKLAFFVKTTPPSHAPLPPTHPASISSPSPDPSHPPLTLSTISSTVYFGTVDGSLMDSLLRHMSSIYLPTFLASSSWPDSVKKDFTTALHRFMASLTEATHQAKGHTVLYLPDEPAPTHDSAADKDYVQRLESSVIHWTRQIKEVVSNVDYSHHAEASGPLEEVDFWRRRTVDLSGIRAQLEREGVKRIVQVLQQAASSYLTPFSQLALSIQQGSREANNNLLFLSTLEAPCQQLAAARPADIPALLPTIANLVRMIWTHSGFYNTEERLTGLLRKVSNQIIAQCSASIQLGEIFDGDVLGSMVTLQQSIQCGAAWHAVYEQTCRLIEKDAKCSSKWRFDPSTHGIFAQLDAFSQRAHNLLEVCEGQLQFARRNIFVTRAPPTTDATASIDAPAPDASLTSSTTPPTSPPNSQPFPLRATLPTFGGHHGSETEKSLAEIESTFSASIAVLRALDYDVCNVRATSWHYDYATFKNTLKDLEVMLANVMASAWECVASVSAGVELLEHFHSLAVRPAMKSALDRKVVELFAMFAAEVKRVKTEFDRQKKDPPLTAGQPRFAGAALWAKSLLARVEVEYFAIVNAAYLCSPAQLEEAKRQYAAFEGMIEGYVRQQHSEWVETVQLSNTGQHAASLSQRLQRPLMIRADTKEDQSLAQAQVQSLLKQSTSSMGLRVAKSGHLEVNFDHHLLKLFNEVRYWDRFHGIYPIPYVAYEMYQHQDSLRIVREAVMLVVRDYNTIVDALPHDDRRLFTEHLRRVDRKISPGLAKLTWNEKHIKDWFVTTCREQCGRVYDIVTQFKANHESIVRLCQHIAELVTVDIEANTVYDDAVFEDRQRKHQQTVRAQLEKAHGHIVTILQHSYTFFQDHAADIQAEWRRYVRKTDARVEEALRLTVKRSLQEFSRAINGDHKSKSEAHPLFRVNMVLDEAKGKVEFRPSVKDLAELIQQISKESIRTIQTVPRMQDVLEGGKERKKGGVQEEEKTQLSDAPALQPSSSSSSPSLPSFFDAISGDEEVLKTFAHIMHGTSALSVELSKLCVHYERYAPIWNTDKAAFIRRYANTKRPLSSFELDISRYKNNQSDITSEDVTHAVGFIKVDCSLLKHALVQHCIQWVNKLTNLLHHNASTELHQLHAYFSDNAHRLSQQPLTLEQLSDSLALLKQTQADLTSFQSRFAPCEDMFRTLDKFDFAISEEEKELVDALKLKGNEYVRVVQEADVSLKAKMVEMKRELEEGLLSFIRHVADLKNEFKEKAPFAVLESHRDDSGGGGDEKEGGGGEGVKDEDSMPDVAAALLVLSEYRVRLKEQRDKAEGMRKGIALFALKALDLSDLDECERELAELERVWGLIREWEDKFRRWRGCAFFALNLDEMDAQAQAVTKQLLKMSKAIKGWRVHKSISAIVAKFRLLLPVISDLRSHAMRARHWDSIQDEMGLRFDINSMDFHLDDFYKLNLTSHAELIHHVAAVALRELGVEKQLKEISAVWEGGAFKLNEYKGRYRVIAEVDDINDALESHQLLLSTMKNSPYYPTFAAEVNYYAQLCNDISEMVELLTAVQKAWKYLESIFVDSHDIKRQLPSESNFFQAVHTDWLGIIATLQEEGEGGRIINLLSPAMMVKLNKMHGLLERINHSLNDYLEKKRQAFARFYWLSNEDLLEILGLSKEPLEVNAHIRKLFTGVQRMDVRQAGEGGAWEVVGLFSAEGEHVRFLQPVQVEGDVELWLRGVETAIAECLQKLLYISITHINKVSSKKSALENWVRSSLGQLLLLSGQIGWTAKVTAALNDLVKNRKALKKVKAEWHDYLNKLAKYVRSDALDELERLKLLQLITVEVHARDVIDRLRQVAKARERLSVHSFEWMSQLRFYYVKEQGEYGSAVIKQTNTTFTYRHEYISNEGRLVITPLTDRCYITLTTALHLALGGSPVGPAGTGKTETVKDLAKNLGQVCIIYNGSEHMTVESLTRQFSGLAQTGAWGCFDEFNRISIEVLSVIALTVNSLFSAVRSHADTVTLDAQHVRLNRSMGLFITMNPGYAGRTELPDNLSSLFRPVAMIAPDTELITEILLQSEGFKDAAVLSKKIMSLYSLIERQLSQQSHYAYGLRNIKAVLGRAGHLIRLKENAELTEELIVMRALREGNASKLIRDDLLLFDALLSDVFPNLELPQLDYAQLLGEVERQLKAQQLTATPTLMEKVVQLYETKLTRHGIMLVGAAQTGKTCAWKTLAATLSALAERGVEGVHAVEVSVLNPKAITTAEMFGRFTSDGEWRDGVLASLMRRACTSPPDVERWILMDGPVDTLWIESLNTVLDDTKVLTLINGDRISLPSHVRLMFEVEDLAVASPATVSRCGMVYFDHSTVGWRPLVQAWLARKMQAVEAQKAADAEAAASGQPAVGAVRYNMSKEGVDFLGKLMEKYAVPALAFKLNPANEMREVLPLSDVQCVQTLTRLFDCVATAENGVDCALDEANYMRLLELQLTFAVVWSIGATLDEPSRVKFDIFVRDVEAQFPPLQSVYEYYVDGNKKDWALWEEKVNNAWRPSPATPFHRILVPTIDTVRHSFLLSALVKQRTPTLVIGGTGTGKTSVIASLLHDLDPLSLSLTLTFSAATSAELTQEMIESRLEKRQRGSYGPQGAKQRLVVFIDDLNLPRHSEYGSVPVHELLRQWLDYGFWYDRSKQSRKTVVDMQLLAAMGLVGGARAPVTARLQSKMAPLHFVSPAEAQVKRIFRTLIVNHFSEFDEPIKPLGLVLTQATLDVYRAVSAEFLPVPASSHYLFNLRDLSRVVYGLLQSVSRHYDSRESVLRLWVHECLRVFSDRLVTEGEREKLVDLLNSKLHTQFESNWKKLFKDHKAQPMFTDLMEEEITATTVVKQGDDEAEEKRPYIDVTHKQPKLRAFIEEQLLAFNKQSSHPVELVMFDSAVEHLTRIHRILTQPRGSALLIGVGGSGRSSLVRLCCHINRFACKELAVGVGYRMADFHGELKDVYLTCGMKQQTCVLLVNDSQLVHEDMLEDLNAILTSGEIPRLFPPEELTPMLEELRTEASRAGRATSTDALYAFFIERVRNHLHLVLCLSPVGGEMRNRLRMFPALVNTCSIDWYSKWPTTALTEVAARLLKDTQLAAHTAGSAAGGAEAAKTSSAGLAASNHKLKEQLCAIFPAFHQAAVDTASRMSLEIKRHHWVTPTKYLDLIQGYKQLLRGRVQHIEGQRSKLHAGLEKLESSGEQVKVMTVQLEEKKKTVAAKKAVCDKLLVEIVQKQRAADEQKKQVELDAARTEVEAKDCESIKHEAQDELDKVLPALDKAVKALERLSKSAVTEVKSYQKPPKPVERVMCAVMTVMDKEASWAMAKKELNDANFLYKLKEFDKDKISNVTLKAIQKYTKSHDFNPDDIGNVSQAAGALCEWVIAMEMYAKVFRDVEPRRIALRKAEDSLKTKQSELEDAETQLREVRMKVSKLEETFGASENEQNILRKEAEALEGKLKAAAKLVDGLSSEKTRWEQSIRTYQVDLKNLMGDCAIASAFIAYAGPFPAQYRDALMKKSIIPTVKRLNVSATPNFSIPSFLSSDTAVREWGIEGLPTDSFSVENGVLVAGSLLYHWPLLIDPQEQGKRWLKKRSAAQGLETIEPGMSPVARSQVLERALSCGMPLLVQDIGEELDPLLDEVLRMNLLERPKDRAISVNIGKKEIVCHPSFMLYLTTKLHNPSYSPEVTLRLSLINFSVIELGLQNQLLGLVVRLEEPRLEADKHHLTVSVTQNKRQLMELEDEILDLLSHADKGSLLEDEVLITALTSSKEVSESVKTKLSASAVTEGKIDAAREQYRSCAVRASVCFFALNELAAIDPMYQFSMQAYLALFEHSIKQSRLEGLDGKGPRAYASLGGRVGSAGAPFEEAGGPPLELLDRINQLNDYHTTSVYHYGCHALFDKHRMLFAFRLCLAKLRSEDKLDDAEYDFFLRGGQVFDRSARPANPCAEWLSEVGWDHMSELSKLPTFNGLLQSFESNAAEWKAWYRSEEPMPERTLAPFDWNQNSTGTLSMKTEKRDTGAFQHLLLLRCLRPDRVVFAARQFISTHLGPQFAESPTVELVDVAGQMTATTPLIFILSSGVDPTTTIQMLATQQQRTVQVLALGQGQPVVAMKMLQAAMLAGHWLYLANLHLSIRWLPELDKLIESLPRAVTPPHPHFRLFLSSNPHSLFPISLLQSSIKITTEPPRGLKANMLRLYSSFTDAHLSRSHRPERYRRLLFALVFFHAVVVERRKFGALGWTQSYAFNDGDLQVSDSLLALYVSEYEETPWEALRYLIAQCNYGGRVTEQQDRRVLDVYAAQMFNEQTLAPHFTLSTLDTYHIPDDCTTVDQFRAFIQQLPSAADDPPEAFGQHSNADIASQMEDTKRLLSSILTLQPKVVVEGGRSREEVVLDLISTLSDTIPKPFDLRQVKAKYGEAERAPLTIVLLQEMERYNALLYHIHSSMADLVKGIKGLALISPELERMFDSLYHSTVPQSWQHYPSLKPLGSWSRDLYARVLQLRRWHEEELPKVFWLGGLMFPTGFLTALLQQTARRGGVGIEGLSWEWTVMTTAESAVVSRPKDGAYIKGLYMEGARWDADNACLTEAGTMELYSSMPLVHFKPVEGRKKGSKGLHALPLYQYPVRRPWHGQETLLGEVELKSGGKDSSFWTRRGVALLLSLEE